MSSDVIYRSSARLDRVTCPVNWLAHWSLTSGGELQPLKQALEAKRRAQLERFLALQFALKSAFIRTESITTVQAHQLKRLGEPEPFNAMTDLTEELAQALARLIPLMDDLVVEHDLDPSPIIESVAQLRSPILSTGATAPW